MSQKYILKSKQYFWYIWKSLNISLQTLKKSIKMCKILCINVLFYKCQSYFDPR